MADDTVTEMVTPEQIDKMTKDELDVYALAEFSVELDKSSKVSVLREQVKALLAKKSGGEPATAEPEAPPVKTSTHLKNTKTGLIFETTELLLKHGERDEETGNLVLVPCDKDGNLV